MSFRRNPNFMPELKARVSRRAVVAGELVRQKMQTLIEEPKSGSVYPGNPRASSAPGEAPASQSGDLVESLEVSAAIDNDSSIDVHVFSWLTRSRVLQDGTIDKAPRPFMVPALHESKTSILKTVSGQGVSDG